MLMRILNVLFCMAMHIISGKKERWSQCISIKFGKSYQAKDSGQVHYPSLDVKFFMPI